MKKSLLFLIACLALCLIPTVGFFFFPTTETSENRPMSKKPEFVNNGRLNQRVFDEFTDYYNDHMGLRNYIVTADACIQETLFGVSNVDGVIVGTDGWLYYSSTLNDYLGNDVLSERKLYNLAHNLSIIYDYLRDRQIDFVVMIPPNKNTLYGNNMPYYDGYIVNSEHSAVLLKKYLVELNVPYLDLFELLEAQEEVLYMERDSHWNTKGACIVYNAVLDKFAVVHETYEGAEIIYERIHYGDLDRMLHSFYGTLEEDYIYSMKNTYSFEGENADVTDGVLISKNPAGKGVIMMFRDSFANNLIPFFSDHFALAYYSKGIPIHLESDLQVYEPDIVIIEKVERNITDYLYKPPIISPVQSELPLSITIAETASELSLSTCEYDVNYYVLAGTIDSDRIRTNTEVVVSVNGVVYRAYQTDENEFFLYLKKTDFEAEESLKVRVFAINGDECVRVLATEYVLENR